MNMPRATKVKVLLWGSLSAWFVYVNIFALLEGFSLLDALFEDTTQFSYEMRSQIGMIVGVLPLALVAYGFSRSFVLTETYRKFLAVDEKRPSNRIASILGLSVIVFLAMAWGLSMFYVAYNW